MVGRDGVYHGRMVLAITILGTMIIITHITATMVIHIMVTHITNHTAITTTQVLHHLTITNHRDITGLDQVREATILTAQAMDTTDQTQLLANNGKHSHRAMDANGLTMHIPETQDHKIITNAHTMANRHKHKNTIIRHEAEERITTIIKTLREDMVNAEGIIVHQATVAKVVTKEMKIAVEIGAAVVGTITQAEADIVVQAHQAEAVGAVAANQVAEAGAAVRAEAMAAEAVRAAEAEATAEADVIVSHQYYLIS